MSSQVLLLPGLWVDRARWGAPKDMPDSGGRYRPFGVGRYSPTGRPPEGPAGLSGESQGHVAGWRRPIVYQSRGETALASPSIAFAWRAGGIAIGGVALAASKTGDCALIVESVTAEPL
jgi:hypothetical protein